MKLDNAAIDETHAEAADLRTWINETFLEAKLRAAKWEPRPCPDDYER
jgi:hypothetical protein